MGINSKITKKINEKCEKEKDVKALIIDLLNFENEGKAHYKEEYKKMITKHIEEIKKYEN